MMNNQNTRNGVWDRIAGSWKQVSGHARTQWGKLTDDDMQQIKGQRDVLVGKLQERYGYAKEEADKQAANWADTLKW